MARRVRTRQELAEGRFVGRIADRRQIATVDAGAIVADHLLEPVACFSREALVTAEPLDRPQSLLAGLGVWVAAPPEGRHAECRAVLAGVRIERELRDAGAPLLDLIEVRMHPVPFLPLFRGEAPTVRRSLERLDLCAKFFLSHVPLLLFRRGLSPCVPDGHGSEWSCAGSLQSASESARGGSGT